MTSAQLLHLLKTRGEQATGDIAAHFEISRIAARKMLLRLHGDGLVIMRETRGNIGRPRQMWSLSEAAAGHFPDTHEFLTLELINAGREVFGEVGLEKLIDWRERTTQERYLRHIGNRTTLYDRLLALRDLRSREGYMCEVNYDAEDKSYLLVENHCPICAAARQCQGLCRSELDLFRNLFANQATIERSDHILAGARRCAYIIRPLL